HALRRALEVRRRVEPGRDTRGAGDGVERGRGRPLPVRAGDEDRGDRPLGTCEPLAHGVDRLETEPDSPLAEGLEAGEMRETGGVRGAQAGYAAGRPSHIRPRQRASVAFISDRSTMRSSIPCSSRNSDRWKPSGSVWRIVCSITRGPAKPMRALGSAM